MRRGPLGNGDSVVDTETRDDLAVEARRWLNDVLDAVHNESSLVELAEQLREIEVAAGRLAMVFVADDVALTEDEACAAVNVVNARSLLSGRT